MHGYTLNIQETNVWSVICRLGLPLSLFWQIKLTTNSFFGYYIDCLSCLLGSKHVFHLDLVFFIISLIPHLIIILPFEYLEYCALDPPELEEWDWYACKDDCGGGCDRSRLFLWDLLEYLLLGRECTGTP